MSAPCRGGAWGMDHVIYWSVVGDSEFSFKEISVSVHLGKFCCSVGSNLYEVRSSFFLLSPHLLQCTCNHL
ncbi:hypothetical protein XENTR_v10002723 [Xenopus tropicalis]|nr:hypothetical protein XENTR_v10002723 [Xenopus tropicalis]